MFWKRILLTSNYSLFEINARNSDDEHRERRCVLRHVHGGTDDGGTAPRGDDAARSDDGTDSDARSGVGNDARSDADNDDDKDSGDGRGDDVHARNDDPALKLFKKRIL